MSRLDRYSVPHFGAQLAFRGDSQAEALPPRLSVADLVFAVLLAVANTAAGPPAAASSLAAVPVVAAIEYVLAATLKLARFGSAVPRSQMDQERPVEHKAMPAESRHQQPLEDSE